MNEIAQIRRHKKLNFQIVLLQINITTYEIKHYWSLGGVMVDTVKIYLIEKEVRK